MHQTAPTTNNYLAQDVSSVFTAEKLWARDRPSDFKGASGTHGEERQSALTGPSVKTGIQEGRLLYREMRERSLPAKLSLYFLIHCLCLSSLSKKQVSFNSMAEVTIHSDFRVQENKIHFSPFYLPWSGGVKCHDLNYWMLSFKPAFSLSSFTLIRRLFSSSSLSAIRVVIICISEVVDISPGNLDSSLCFIQPGISHDVLCM